MKAFQIMLKGVLLLSLLTGLGCGDSNSDDKPKPAAEAPSPTTNENHREMLERKRDEFKQELVRLDSAIATQTDPRK